MKLLFGLSRDATTVWRSSLFAVRLVALVMGSVAFSGVLWITEPAGPGLQVSSAAYLGAAGSLAAGHGLRVPTATWDAPDSTTPLTRYPAGFPVAIALPVTMGFPPIQAARLVEALSAFVAMAALLATVGDAAGAGAAAALGLALLVMPMMVDVHLSVLSEPFFLALLALTFAVMVGAPDAALAAGVCAALAMQVRYAGIAVVLAVVLWMLIRGRSWKVRLRRAVIATLPAVAISGTWLSMVRRAVSAGAAAPTRSLAAAGRDRGLIAPLAGAGATLARWLVPTSVGSAWPLWVAVPVAALVVAVVAIGTRRTYRLWHLLPRDLPLSSSTNVPQLLAARVLGASAVLVGAYVGVLIAAKLFTDRAIALDYRMLAPAALVASAAITVAAANWWRSAGRPARVVAGALFIVWCGGSLAVSRRHTHEALTYGYDLGHDAWRRSSVLEWMRNDGNRRPIYSNWPAVSYFYLDRPARGIPTTMDPETLRAFGDTLARRGGGGVVLAFSSANPAYVATDSLIRALGLQVLATYPDGRVLGPAVP